MMNLYPLLHHRALVLLLSLSPLYLIAQTPCTNAPADFNYSPDGLAVNQVGFRTSFIPMNQGDFDGDECAVAVGVESGIVASEAVGVESGVDGDGNTIFYFSRIEIARTVDCYATIFVAPPTPSQVAQCQMFDSQTALQIADGDQTGMENYEGFAIIIFDPDDAMYQVFAGTNGEGLSADGASTTGGVGAGGGFGPPPPGSGDSTDNPPTAPGSGTVPTGDPEPGGDSFGSADGAIASDVLPVELTLLTARYDGKQVRLNWTTATEDNNDFFAIERMDGTTFRTIGVVEGAGNSQTAVDYQFNDPAPELGTNYYRLRQVDFGGATNYSPIISVEVGGATGSGLFLAPNPVAYDLTLRLGGQWKEEVAIQLIDATGRVVTDRQLEYAPVLTLDLSRQQAGIYHLSVTDGSRREVRRLVKR